MKLNDILNLWKAGCPTETISVFGNAEIDIQGLNLCNRASVKQRILSYAVSEKYAERVQNAARIIALIVAPQNAECYRAMIAERLGCLIICSEPEIVFYSIHEVLFKAGGFYPDHTFPPKIGKGCAIAPSAVIERGTIIGNRVVIGANTVIRPGSVIDDDVMIGCNSTIGGEGFQVIRDSDCRPVRISHAGGCHLYPHVAVGDNTCVCNSLFEGATHVGRGTKLDNLIHCAHNVYVGSYVTVCAHVAICGSARIEDGAWIAPNASILNQVTVGKRAKIGLGSVVTRDIPPETLAYGVPAKVHKIIADA